MLIEPQQCHYPYDGQDRGRIFPGAPPALHYGKPSQGWELNVEPFLLLKAIISSEKGKRERRVGRLWRPINHWGRLLRMEEV